MANQTDDKQDETQVLSALDTNRKGQTVALTPVAVPASDEPTENWWCGDERRSPILPYEQPADSDTDHESEIVHRQTSTNPDPEPLEDFRPLFRATLWASLLMLVSKGGSTLKLAEQWGGRIELRPRFGFLPTLAIFTSPARFGDIVTWSVVISTVAMCAGLGLAALIVKRDRGQRIFGWFLGIVMAAVSLIIESLRHFFLTPALDSQWGIQCAVFLAVAGFFYLVFRPRSAGSAGTEGNRNQIDAANPSTNEIPLQGDAVK